MTMATTGEKDGQIERKRDSRSCYCILEDHVTIHQQRGSVSPTLKLSRWPREVRPSHELTASR